MNRKRPGLCGQVPTNEKVTDRVHYLISLASSLRDGREKQTEAYEDFGRALGEHYDYDGIVVAEIKIGSLR